VIATTDWATISSLATAAGTLVLGIATFVAVRSANRSARVAERALQAGLRPLLLNSRLTDPAEKIMWQDQHWAKVPGGRAHVAMADDVIYLSMSLRNAGAGIAVLDAWDPWPERPTGVAPHHDITTFRRLTRDLYIAAGDVGLWQGALRDPAEPIYEQLRAVIDRREMFGIDLLYSDHEGGQRTVGRFALIPTGDDDWMLSHSKHWNIDRDDPR
jgi:hypothetical protein